MEKKTKMRKRLKEKARNLRKRNLKRARVRRERKARVMTVTKESKLSRSVLVKLYKSLMSSTQTITVSGLTKTRARITNSTSIEAWLTMRCYLSWRTNLRRELMICSRLS